MIAYLNGRLHAIYEDSLVLDVNGVGYQVFCTQTTLHSIGGLGDTCALEIETQVRDDSITLYGFAERETMAWFRRVQKIQGVGARLALAILSTLNPHDLQLAIQAQDKAALTRAPGVGAKLAQRIMTELRDIKLEKFAPAAQSAMPVAGASTSKEADAISALVNLGYSASESLAAVRTAQSEGADAGDVGALVTGALKVISQ